MFTVDFRQVDVFTSVPFKGNPVAVVMDAHFLSSEQMQEIARWTNLSETTFVLSPEHKTADYRVRIFTPGGELPFAGHPTIGTAWALLEAGVIVARDGLIIQECEAGLIQLAVNTTSLGTVHIAFELPEPVITELTTGQTDRLEEILGCRIDRSLCPALIDVGARWIVAHAENARSVINLTPDYALLGEHDKSMNVTGLCIYGEHDTESDFKIEVRSFAPACGVNEDPVCGSGNGSVAAFLRHHNVMLPESRQILSSQGQVTGRDGKLKMTLSDGKIWVGGNAVTCISGKIMV
ncbi:PhzF family phenazine biosynthesis protein (plasmid) [Pantoea vagans]|uniref:PhzF family phenazine biosynthesis protein n=1 Tax=Pantoea vagans TaxID=470934 RepID=UPI0035197C86